MKKIKFYNSLSNKIEEFVPIEANKVSMYVCGPTVYNHVHIGNARPIVVFDVLYRFLRKLGYDVTYMSNITDIDDKIINAALKEGISEKEIAEKYYQAYQEVRQGLNALNPDLTPKVTENIQGIIDFIAKMIDLGYAYEKDGDVFFRVSKVKSYGQLGNFDINDLKVGARIEENEQKESPFDFALWKKTDSGIKWDTPWCAGRPGWHTECVVMINQNYTRGLIDIHGGGFDLKFPHHENEIAQSQVVNNTCLANYWLHNGMINIDNVKMSKSLGNIRWAKDLIETYSGNVVRWLLLSTHYRAPLNFTDEVMNNAVKEIEKIFTALRAANVKMELKHFKNAEVIESQIDAFLDTLADDLNTSNGQTIIFEMVKQLNQAVRGQDLVVLSRIFNTLIEMLSIFGIKYDIIVLSSEDYQLFHKWEEARANKDFAASDFFRQQLINKKLL